MEKIAMRVHMHLEMLEWKRMMVFADWDGFKEGSTRTEREKSQFR